MITCSKQSSVKVYQNMLYLNFYINSPRGEFSEDTSRVTVRSPNLFVRIKTRLTQINASHQKIVFCSSLIFDPVPRTILITYFRFGASRESKKSPITLILVAKISFSLCDCRSTSAKPADRRSPQQRTSQVHREGSRTVKHSNLLQHLLYHSLINSYLRIRSRYVST